MPQSKTPIAGRALAEFILLAAIWGASFLFMRLASDALGALPAAGLRVSIAALALSPLLIWRGQWAHVRQRPLAMAVVGVLNSGAPFALIAFALHTLGTGLSSVLNATVPLFGALVAWAWLGERPARTQALGLLIGFIGVALLASDKAGFRPDVSDLWTRALAVSASLAACLCYGLSASFTRRHLVGVPPLATATGSQIGAALALALPTWWLWPAQWPTPGVWAALLAAGLVCTALAYILFFRLIERVGAARALTVTFLIPVFGTLYGVLLLGEHLTAWMLGCAVLVGLGTALAMGLIGRRG